MRYTIIFILFLIACNFSRRYRVEQAHLIVQDSTAQTQDNTASKSDSTSSQENTEVTTKYYDSSLQAALELAFDNQTDYANQSGAYEKLTPIVVTKLGDTGYSIDPGGRNLKTANLKYNRQNKKSDSTAKKNTSNVAVAKADTVSKAANIVVKKKEEARAVVVQKKTWRPSPWMISGVVLLIVLAAGVYYFRKPLGLARKVQT